MSVAEKGNGVAVHYTGKLKNGNVFDSSEGKDPLKFNIGGGRVIPGFETAVVGMEEGEKKTIEISMNDAYGPRRDDMVAEFKREQFPEDMELKPGMVFQLNNPDGQTLPVVITEVKDESVLVDGNHPLAGQDLIFDLELVSVGEPYKTE